jgi:DnaJ-class molecular chaperone
MNPSMRQSGPDSKTYYELLGVSYYANPDDVRNACERRLAALDRMRPEGVEVDEPAQAQERRDIMLAYLTLKDAQKKNAYNASLAAANSARDVAKARDADSGLSAPGWGADAGPSARSGGQPHAVANFGNTVATVRTDELATVNGLRAAVILMIRTGPRSPHLARAMSR